MGFILKYNSSCMISRYIVDRHSLYFPHNISDLEIDRTFFEYESTINTQNWKKEWNIIVSRWCIYDCAFCSAENSESIINEIKDILSLHPEVKSIRVLDDLFLKNEKSIKLAIEIFKNFDLSWRAMAHIKSFNNISNELLLELKNSWCEELSIWIESWNENILNNINKTDDLDEIKITIEKIFNSWIWVKWYFIFWFPWETEKEFQDTYDLAKFLKLKSIEKWVIFRLSVFQFRPYHWTKLYNDLEKKWYEIWKIEAKKLENSVSEYDFSSWNYSDSSDENLEKYISITRDLNNIWNNLKTWFLKYKVNLENHSNAEIFFVWLSNKKDKNFQILEPFSELTNSGKFISEIEKEVLEKNSVIKIYKTNLVKWVPLDKNLKIRYPNNFEKAEWFQVLLQEIELLRPKKIFLFWKEVSDFFIKNLDLEKISENKYLYWEILIIFEFHPSYILVYKNKEKENFKQRVINEIIQ